MSWPFWVFEVSTTLLFLAVISNAYKRRGLGRVWEVVVSAVYGVALESETVHIFSAYRYGSEFLVMMGGVPLSIGFMWATVIYAVMEFNGALINRWLRPLLDAMLAIGIDLVLDPIAVRLGLWVWLDIPVGFSYFGVMIGNFYGWLFVVLLFSGLVRLLRARLRWWTPVSASLVALIILPLMLVASKDTLSTLPPLLAIALLIALAALTATAIARETIRPSVYMIKS